MKKLLITLGLSVLTLTSALAQGTIAFGNGTLTKITVLDQPGVGARNATASDGLAIGVFYGPAGSGQDYLTLAPGVAGIGPNAGIMMNAPSIFSLPGTEAGQVVSLQIRMWSNTYGSDWEAVCRDNAYLGATAVKQVTLGTADNATVIWQTASGTSASRFTPLIQALGPMNIQCIPEPSTLALGALAGAFLLFHVRKSTKAN